MKEIISLTAEKPNLTLTSKTGKTQIRQQTQKLVLVFLDCKLIKTFHDGSSLNYESGLRFLLFMYSTLELQWLKYLWNHENMFKTGVVGANKF